MDIEDIVGKNINQKRLELNWSQEELAHQTGLSTSTISKLENGKRNCGLETLMDIAMAMNCEIGDLTVPLENYRNEKKKKGEKPKIK